MKSVQQVLAEKFNLIQTELIRFQNNPYSIDRVHDLRVSIRTLRGLFKFLKQEIPQTTFEDIDQTLSDAAMIFGPLRELDVLISQASSFAYAHPDSQSDYQSLFQDFHDKREAAMHQVLAAASQQQLMADLDNIEEHLKTLAFDKTTDWHKYIVRELKRRTDKVIRNYDRLDFNNYGRVHQIRKKAKTVRYAATTFADFAPKLANKVGKKAKAIQDESGRITDAHVNDGLLRQFAARTNNPSEAKLLLQMAQAQRNIIADSGTKG
ncbi:CHAD domain-containing protein [Lentilactobacillus kisonensis]|nr:CHAD domain-containing protein [Lentilactobacillus kisonensis]